MEPVEPRKRRHGPRRGASDPAPSVKNTRPELCELLKSSSRTSKTDPEAVLSLWVILRRTKMISIPFFHLKCAKWNTSGGAGIPHGATETTPWAAPRSFGSSAERVRNTRWELCELWRSSARTFKNDPEAVLRSTVAFDHLGMDENDFDPFFHLKCAKWNKSGIAGGAHGATETTPPAAPRSLVPRAGGQDYVSS